MNMRRVAVLSILVLVLVSCGLTDGGTTVTEPSDITEPSDTTAAPDPTDAPETTSNPDTTAAPGTSAPDGEEESSTPWWLLIVVLGAFLILVMSFISRGSKKKVEVTHPQATWKENAQRGYADARWVYDALTEDLAIWRGNAIFESTSTAGDTAATSLAQTWQQLESRVGQASDNLYSLEATAPDQRTADQAGATTSSMRTLRRAVDDRAESRMNYRRVESTEGVDTDALTDAREREVRSSRALAEARSAFGVALTNLSTLL